MSFEKKKFTVVLLISSGNLYSPPHSRNTMYKLNAPINMGRGDVEAGHFNLAEIFRSNASPQDICGWSKEVLNINNMLLESSPKLSLLIL